MSYNDKQQNNEHLLIWLNTERSYLGEHNKLQTLDRIQSSNILALLLLKIQPVFFSAVNHGGYDFMKYLDLIQKYLLKVQDLKIKRRQRQQLIVNQSISEIVRMVLFLIMRSEKKQQFVGRILDLEDQVQLSLMNELKRIQNTLENNMEIKQIFSRIEELQDENQQLYSKLQQAQKQQRNIETIQKQFKQQNQRLILIQRNITKEKSHLMEDLGLQITKDYYTIFKELQCERQAILTLQKQVQDSNFNLAQDNQQMLQKLVEDKQIIDYLTEEIGCYKDSLLQLKMEKKKQVLYKSSGNDKENLKNDTPFTSSLKDTGMLKSVEAETTICSFKNVTIIEQEQVGYIMKDYNGDLMAKLQKMYATINLLNQQIVDLKNGNNALIQNNNRKERKMRRAERQFREFCLNYDFTISG